MGSHDNKIPLMNIRDMIDPVRGQIDEVLKKLIDGTQFILGKPVDDFERNFAAFCRIPHAIGCANGTDALMITLKAAGIRPGDKVIVPVNSFIATSEAVTAIGAQVVFADADETYSHLDPVHCRSILAKDRNRSIRGIMPVHLYGQMADMPALKQLADEYGLAVIEDAAQAHGSSLAGKGVGHWGDFATFSFYPGKNLGAFGDAGGIISTKESLAEKARMLVNHGRLPGDKYLHRIEGYNMRIDTIQAAILDIKLTLLSSENEKRRRKADLYRQLLGQVQGIIIPEVRPEGVPVWYTYVIRVPGGRRDALAEHLNRSGIATGIYYPVPLHLQPAYEYTGYKKGDFPVAEKLATEILSLPMWGDMTEDQLVTVAGAVKDF
jgi:dTDP-4-amino-4,6-dideoxygalactose transaminase